MLIRERKISIDAFFYLAMYLITFDIFPFYRYGLGSGKALSLLPLIVYLFLKLPQIRISKYQIIDFSFILILLILSFLISMNAFNDITGTMQAVSMWLTYAITILAFSHFIYSADREKIKKMLLCIFRSFYISLFFGLLELFYFRISSFSFIKSFITLFVRDGMYLEGGRLQFNFGEPGSMGTMIVCLFIPSVLFLRKLKYNFSIFDKILILGIFVLSFYSISITYILTLIVLSCTYYALYKIKSKVKLFFFITFFVGILIGFNTLINSPFFYTMAMQNDSRILKLLLPSENNQNDDSSLVRTALWDIAVISYKERPVLGYGWGNFKYAFMDNYMKTEIGPLPDEFYEKYDQSGLQSYSIYSTALCEGGIIGVIWLLFFIISRYRKTSVFSKPFFITCMFLCIQCIFIYTIPLLLAILIFSEKRIKKIFDENNLPLQ